MDDKSTAHWFEGFVKAANDLGVTDPDEVAALHKLSQQLELRAAHQDAFDQGAMDVLKKAGVLEKDAAGISPGLMALLLGGGTLAGLGLHSAAQRGLNTALDAGNAWRRGKYMDLYNRTSSDFNTLRGLPGMYRPNPFGGMYGPNAGAWPYGY